MKNLQKMKEHLEKALVYANEHSKENQLQYTSQYSKKDKHEIYSGGMTCPRVFVRKKNGLLCQAHICVNLMHKHDLILDVFYVSEPFNLCCDSNDCAGETVLALYEKNPQLF